MRLNTKRIEAEVTVERNGQIGHFRVHPLTPKETADFLNKSKQTEWDKGQRFQEPDYYKYKLLKINTVILGWDATDENDNPLPCNDETRELAYLNDTDLIDEVLDKAAELSKAIEAEEKEKEKNL